VEKMEQGKLDIPRVARSGRAFYLEGSWRQDIQVGDARWLAIALVIH
jgi:hypothetical protein